MKTIRLLLTASLLSGAYFCVGMGMEMALGQAGIVKKADHSCCPGGAAPTQEDNNGPDCCAFVPTVGVSGIVIADSDAFVVLALASPSSVKTRVSGTVASTRAPPDYASPPLSSPSSRAPPVV